MEKTFATQKKRKKKNRRENFHLIFFSFLAKKLKDKNIKNNITVPFMVGAGKGAAALPVTIALCLKHILLVHVVSSSNFLYL